MRNNIKKIVAAKGKASQGRLESFFGPSTVKSSTVGPKKPDAKAAAKGKGGAAAKGGAFGAKGGVKKAPLGSLNKKK